MAGEQPDRFRLGRTIAQAGVFLAIGLAIVTMLLLLSGLMPQIFPTLFPAPNSVVLMPMTSASANPNSANLNSANPNSSITAAAVTPEQLRSMIETARQSWLTGNIARFTSLFTASGEFIVPGQVYRGRHEIQAAMAEFFDSHSDVTIQIQQIILEGSRAAVEWHWEDTEIATGQRTIADDAIIVDFQGDRIARWREYIDATDPAKATA